jgi:hypothetical protein
MRPERPVSVLVLAILNIVFGILGLLSGLCGLTVFGLAAGGQVGAEAYAEMQRVGGLGAIAFQFVQPSCSLIFCPMLIASGIGLLRMKPWAWWLAVVYAVYCTLMTLAQTVFEVVLANPVEARVALHESPLADAVGDRNLVLTLWHVWSVGWGLGALSFAFATLVILFLPSVRAAFAASSAARGEEER